MDVGGEHSCVFFCWIHHVSLKCRTPAKCSFSALKKVRVRLFSMIRKDDFSGFSDYS